MWDRLPPRGHQPLLKYIVYPLEESEQISVPSTRKRFFFYAITALALVAAVSAGVLLGRRTFLPGEVYWVDEATHTVFETFSSFISIAVAIVLAWEYYTSGKRNILFLAAAFFSIGIFDFSHALSNQLHSLFIWYHTFGALLGSVLFFASMFVDNSDEPTAGHLTWIRRFAIASGVCLILALAVAPRAFYPYIPDVLSASFPQHAHVAMTQGEFSAFIYVVNYTACLLFLAAGVFFIRGFRRNDDVIYLIFAVCVLLFFTSELFFAFSKLWDPVWWYWHLLKVVNFGALLLGLAYGFTKNFYRLHASKVQLATLLERIEAKKVELEKAYVTLKETQKYLNKSEKLASMGKMAAMMAHEIRNPLCSISNSMGVLKNYDLRPEESAELFTLVEEELDRLNKLTEDFLSFAKPAHVRRDPVDVNRVLAETLSLLEAEKAGPRAIVFRKTFAADLPLLRLDKNRIKQAFINILMNSLQAMPGGGVITIGTTYKKAEEEVEIYFADSGTGMSQAVISQVFQPFFTTKDKGLGLGLNIIHNIVKEHGGYIVISSRENEGTQIKLSFPVTGRTHDGTSAAVSDPPAEKD